MQLFRLEESFDPLSLVQAKALECAEGTRLEVKNKVETWYEESWQQRVLAFLGPAGYGKSVIMASLAVEGGLISKTKGASMFSALKRFSRRLSGKKDSSKKSETQTFSVGAAHLFKHDDVNASSVRVCILSIANQLALTVPGVKDELLKLNQSEIESITDLKVLFRSLLCAPMTRVKTPQHPIVVLLDALDEANADEKGELVEIITTMWESETPQWLRVIVSSRPEGFIKDRFDTNVYALQLESEENVKDLSMFVRQHLEKCMKPAEDIDEAVKIMVNQCDGLFLYASFLDKMLQEREDQSMTLRDITALVKEFPPGLEVVYREYFTRFLQQSLENNYDQYQTLLSSMVAARTSLDVETVAALLELENQDAIEAFLSRAENLVVVEQDGRIRFVHMSMRDFLQDRRRAGRVAEKESFVGGKSLSVSVDRGHKQLVKVLKANPTSPFALEHLIYHLCKRKEWESVREHLLDFDWVHAAVSVPDVARRLIDDTDALYNYESYSDINVTDVIRGIELGRREIEIDPNSLAFELLGRITDRSHPIICSLVSSEFAKSAFAKGMYVPIRPTLEPARSRLRKILDGHSYSVNAVAINGDTVVSGSSDMTVCLWDRRSGDCLHVLKGHSGVTAVAIDGDTVVSGSRDNTVRLWDRRSGECLHVLEGHSDWVNAVAIAGDTVVSGSLDKTLRLWDRRSGECLHVLEGHYGNVNAVAIDGDTVVSGSLDKTLRLWDRRSGDCLHVLEGHSLEVNAVAIDGDTVVSGSWDETVRLWDRKSGECFRVLEGHSETVNAVAIDGDTVVSGSRDKTVRLWDRRSGECLQVLEGHSRSVSTVAIDGDTVVSGSYDKTVRLWDRRSGECLHVLKGHSDWVTAVAIDGDTVVSGSRDNTVRLWDRRSGECLHVLEGHSDLVNAVAIAGDTVVSGSLDKTLRLWDRRSGECLQVLEGHSRSVSTVAIDGDTVVSGSYDTSVCLWDRRSGDCLHVLEGHSLEVNAVAIDGDTVASGSDDETVRLWDRRSGKCFHVLKGHSSWVKAVAIDGDTVVSGSNDKTVRLWDRRSRECLQVLTGHSSEVTTVAIDGDTVVSGSDDKTVRLWDRRSGERLHVFDGHSGDVDAVAVDGDSVVSGSGDKTVRLWDRHSGECLQVVLAPFRVFGVAVENVQGNTWIIFADENSKVPHVLAPFSTLLFT